jgi:hypothetical protein
MRPSGNVTGTLLFASAACIAAALVLAHAGRSDSRARTLSRIPSLDVDTDPPEVQIGERLFLETRFAQFFQAHSGGDVNRPLAVGDPVVASLPTSTGSLPDPFVGTSMNCRNCHFVDDVDGASVRTYGDYSRRSRVPAREDGATTTARNSPPLVNAFLDRQSFFLHFDGQFATVEDLVRTTFTGRNFGWLPGEEALAIAQLAHVIREDDGTGSLAGDYGAVPYRVVLAGTDPAIPDAVRLPPEYRVDVVNASYQDLLDGVARLIGAYLRSLTYSRDEEGLYDGSPYDVFLRKNGLPRAPEPGESSRDYARRLFALVNALVNPQWVNGDDGSFVNHDQAFAFGDLELTGLKIFLREVPEARAAFGERLVVTRTGNCVACHTPPDFTDFGFHNTGASQEEYDDANGDGTFARLFVPNLATRDLRPDDFLPATPQHPRAREVFKAVPSHARPGNADLGLWNVFANADFPGPQSSLQRALANLGDTPDTILPKTIASFKTPTLRDLGQSAPYLHTGRKRELEEVLDFYIDSATKTRQGKLRNPSPELSDIFLSDGDIAPLAAFLRSLNEDYD